MEADRSAHALSSLLHIVTGEEKRAELLNLLLKTSNSLEMFRLFDSDDERWLSTMGKERVLTRDWSASRSACEGVGGAESVRVAFS